VQDQKIDKILEFKDEFAFLSNFFHSPFIHSGICYLTNEHFYQAMKTEDIEIRKKIALLQHPGRVKRYGRSLVLRPLWEENKIRVMRQGIKLKFAEDTVLAKMLVATHPLELFEGNYWGDGFWGVDLKKDNIGENWLGKLLMERREYLLGLLVNNV